jgi:hypothetical protein
MKTMSPEPISCSLKTELHQQRLKNAEQRKQIASLQQVLNMKERELQKTKLDMVSVQLQRDKDLQQFKALKLQL